MYCLHCKKEIFGGSICHLCGKPLVTKEEKVSAETSPETSYLKKPLEIVTRKKYKVSKEFGQTVLGRLLRLALEVVLFCAAFWLLSVAVVKVSNWLSQEMALPGQKARHIELGSRWMRYFWFIGFAAIIFLTVRLRFKPGK
jgi:hypothetical protein